jgi:hypothetical protein
MNKAYTESLHKKLPKTLHKTLYKIQVTQLAVTPVFIQHPCDVFSMRQRAIRLEHVSTDIRMSALVKQTVFTAIITASGLSFSAQFYA